MRFREDKPGDWERVRTAVAEWREQHPEGTAEQLAEAVGGQFHPDYGPVLRGALYAIDQDRDGDQFTMHPTSLQTPAGPYPAPGSLHRLLRDLLERIENSAMITRDVLQILSVPDGPLREDDRAALAIEVAALREDVARDLAGDDTNLQVTLER